ncbi:acyl carrier protein [Arthrobacter sp. MDT3-24]
MNTIDAIRNYVIEEFLPGTDPQEITAAMDLLNSGIIDSLGLLKMIAWIETTFEVSVGDEDLDPENFRSLESMDRFIGAASLNRTAV